AASYANRLAATEEKSNEQKIEKARSAALQKAVRAQKLGPLEEGVGKSFIFALLHASVIRRLLNRSQRVATEKNPEAPIVRVYPRRFEVIIDLNLEYPDGRAAAQEWVLANIDAAKKAAKVNDAGQ